MVTYLIRRVLLMFPTFIGITFVVFMLVALSPGGIGAALRAQGGNLQSQSAVAVQQAYLDDRYGLDAPAVVQYGRWLARLSPVRLGERELVAPNGEAVRPPKALKEPTLWRWFADTLPEEPAASAIDREAPVERRVSRFRAADRGYADARAAYVAAEAMLKESLRRYAEAEEIAGGVTADLKPNLRRIAREGPDKTSAAWADVEARGRASIEAYVKAGAARAELLGAFRSEPYRRGGIPVLGPLHLAKPDLGTAFSRNRPVSELIADALPVTIMLNVVAFPIIYLIAVPSGMLAATYRGTWLDSGLGAGFIALWSFPTVLAGVLAIGFLANRDFLGWFPASGLKNIDSDQFLFLPRWTEAGFERGYLLDRMWHLVLPVACIVYAGFAVLSKQTRAAMLENFNADYVRTAKAKGVAPGDVVLRHVFRNSLIPLITLFVAIFPAMLAGSVVIERIFSIPGMGTLILQAITLRDRELILANAMMIAVVNMMALLLQDVLYALADPRVSYR